MLNIFNSMIKSSCFRQHVYIKLRFKHVDLDTHSCCPGQWLSIVGNCNNCYNKERKKYVIHRRIQDIFYLELYSE